MREEDHGYEMRPLDRGGTASKSEAQETAVRISERTRVVNPLKRIFGDGQMVFLMVTYMNSWEGFTTNAGLPLFNGGPQAVIFGFPIIMIGVLSQAASFGEMSSVVPAPASQYLWAKHFGPSKGNRFIAYSQAYITWFSWISIYAAVVNVGANITTTLASTVYPSYEPQAWHTILIMLGWSLVMTGINTHMFWTVPWVEAAAGVLHIALWVVFVAVLTALGQRHSVSFVFLEGASRSGWDNGFVEFCLGARVLTWSFVGFELAFHLSQETKNPTSKTPLAVIWTLLFNGILALSMAIVFYFFLGDVQAVMDSSYPTLAILRSATGSTTGGCVLVGLTQTMGVAVSLGSILSTSRLTWALAIDGLLPKYFSDVDAESHVPQRSVWLPFVVVFGLSFLNLADPLAFSVIISLSTLGLYQSYLVSIACMLYWRSKGNDTSSAAFSLGKFGASINIVACIYTFLLMVILALPTELPVTRNNMNYALPINVGVWIFIIVSWPFRRRSWEGVNTDYLDSFIDEGKGKRRD